MQPVDTAYWERLRKDASSSWSVGLAFLCVLPAVVGLIANGVGGTHLEAKGSPIYWMLMLPLVWWVTSIGYYEPKTAWTIRPAFVLGPLVCGVNTLWAHSLGTDVTISVVVLIFSVVCAVAGEIVYRRSMLKLEGPAR